MHAVYMKDILYATKTQKLYFFFLQFVSLMVFIVVSYTVSLDLWEKNNQLKNRGQTKECCYNNNYY